MRSSVEHSRSYVFFACVLITNQSYKHETVTNIFVFLNHIPFLFWIHFTCLVHLTNALNQEQSWISGFCFIYKLYGFNVKSKLFRWSKKGIFVLVNFNVIVNEEVTPFFYSSWDSSRDSLLSKFLISLESCGVIWFISRWDRIWLSGQM